MAAGSFDEAQAVDLELQPGQMSLHDVYMIHGAAPTPRPSAAPASRCATCRSTSVFERDLRPADGKTGVRGQLRGAAAVAAEGRGPQRAQRLRGRAPRAAGVAADSRCCSEQPSGCRFATRLRCASPPISLPWLRRRGSASRSQRFAGPAARTGLPNSAGPPQREPCPASPRRRKPASRRSAQPAQHGADRTLRASALPARARSAVRASAAPRHGRRHRVGIAREGDRHGSRRPTRSASDAQALQAIRCSSSLLESMESAQSVAPLAR